MSSTLVAFGVGINFYSLVERIDMVSRIACFSDNNERLWGQFLLGDERECISPERILELDTPFVIIMSEREESIQAIERQCDESGIMHQRVYDYLNFHKLGIVKCCWPQTIQRKRIHKFIELLVHGTTACNFHCEYCYVWRKQEFTHNIITSEYSAKEIREALSLKKLGGPCHINACALGETMLSKDIVELIYELLEEGHYISVITNGTVTTGIEKVLQFPKRLLERMFFKFSYHYEELEHKKLAAVFWKNIDKVINSACSLSIEITPCDSLISQIGIIKEEFEKHAQGAMPHITFTRDSTKEGLDLLSKLSVKEYVDTWSCFGSELFKLKSGLYKTKISQNCYAGNWSYRVNVVNGNLQSCYQQEVEGTIFDENQKVLPVRTIGDKCKLDYCFNNHAFLAWGDVPEVKCATYLEVRDRQDRKNRHWIKKGYAAAMAQKLYDNNFIYKERWSDYEKLFKTGRKPAFILFNSPDYSNLGDHAIAIAERNLFERLFPMTEFIEISCEQYIKENLLIQNVIQNEDILIISGGGYLGSLWIWLEDLTKNIVSVFPENKILIFPQTMYFENNSLGESEKKSISDVFNSHNKLTVMLRDQMSFQLAEKLFGESVHKLLIPDIVFSESYYKNTERHGALVCMREDKETRNFSKEYINEVLEQNELEVKEINTIAEADVNMDNRRRYVGEILDTICGARVVVTDRLHAMIFCVITGTPCIAFDNKSGKVRESFYWLRGIESILFCENLELVDKCLNYIMTLEKKVKRNADNLIQNKFEELEKYLRKECIE